MKNDVFKTGEVWKSPRGLEYTVLYVHTSGMNLPTAKLVRSNGAFMLKGRTLQRWYNDNDGWTRVRSAMETGAES